MKVLVIGSGGREHALVWKIANDRRRPRVYAAPGSAAIAGLAEIVAIDPSDLEALARFAESESIDLTIVGPEGPLAAGIVDEFRARGLRIFGPDRRGAELEASKAFTKRLLLDAGVPTADYGEFEEAAPARECARRLGFPVVVKADGLAAGKGVIICADAAEADRAIDGMLEGGDFGAAGRRVVVEEFLVGEEASFMAITDGITALPLASSQDHKAVFDGDAGPNTGGMGAYSPAPCVTPQIHDEIMRRVIEPTVRTLAARGIDYLGVLYAGIMLTASGPKVLEYNVRFGDPECQALMMRLDSSLLDLVDATIDRTLASHRLEWKNGSSVSTMPRERPVHRSFTPAPSAMRRVIGSRPEAVCSACARPASALRMQRPRHTPPSIAFTGTERTAAATSRGAQSSANKASARQRTRPARAPNSERDQRERQTGERTA